MSKASKSKKKRMGRPPLNPSERRVSLTFHVSPKTEAYFERKAKELDRPRGILLDDLVADA